MARKQKEEREVETEREPRPGDAGGPALPEGTTSDVVVVPTLELRADDEFGFRALIELSHSHNVHFSAERRVSLKTLVREFELWREEER